MIRTVNATDPRPPRLSCIMPAYNEAASLPRVVPEVLAALQALSPAVELIVVDDGSRDDTVAVVTALQQQHPQLVLLQLSRNFGKEAALSAGLDHAQGDAVFIMDSDGQHPVALLPRMLQAWQQGAEVVYAVRRTRDDQTALHRKLAGAFYGLVNWGARVKVPADAGDFRLMDARVVRALRELPEQHRFMKGLYAWVGFRSLALDYEPLPRQAGHSHYGLRGAFRLGTTGLLAFSAAPLRLMGLVGVLLALAALGYGVWVVGEYFVLGIAVPGYATIVVGMMFLAGVQLMSVGLLSEYVARIYDEVKRRPLYLVARRTGQGLPADPNA
jgi:glycosyltransferase involved in cell wall biosynthesis